MRSRNAWLAWRKQLLVGSAADRADRVDHTKTKSDEGFQKLNAARVRNLRNLGRKWKAQMRERLNFSSPHDKLEELISFERGL